MLKLVGLLYFAETMTKDDWLFLGEQEIPGLTDKTQPRRLGPKRASKIRKLFNLSKDDDVRQYVIKRALPLKEGQDRKLLETRANY